MLRTTASALGVFSARVRSEAISEAISESSSTRPCSTVICTATVEVTCSDLLAESGESDSTLGETFWFTIEKRPPLSSIMLRAWLMREVSYKCPLSDNTVDPARHTHTGSVVIQGDLSYTVRPHIARTQTARAIYTCQGGGSVAVFARA